MLQRSAVALPPEDGATLRAENRGWQATVDGQRTHVYQTDYLLRGVTIPAGEHTVEFVFRPASFYLGLGITALSMFGLLALTVR